MQSPGASSLYKGGSRVAEKRGYALMTQEIQRSSQGTQQEKVQPKSKKRLLPHIWRAIKDNAVLVGILATLVSALIGLSGVLLQQHVSATLAQQDAQQKQQLEEQHTQETELQTYFDDMGKLLLDTEQPLRKAKQGDDVSVLAEAKTLSVLDELGSKHRESVARFLLNAKLIQKDAPVVKLARANLREISLSEVNLGATDLTGVNLK